MLDVRDLWHRYTTEADAWSLASVNLTLEPGELLGLLGPSGCGKTTLLRLIAGFERPTRGSIQLNGRGLATPERSLPAERRGIGMVFQDGALFPHLTVWQNACFGLKKESQLHDRVHWLLGLLGIADLIGRYPHELSGGQRQRLALARSLAPSPGLLLLDEPFSNLDVEVRLNLRQELPSVLRDCGASAILVTHDPCEALAICDRVGVMRAGELVQLAQTQTLVREPATSFVAGFVLGKNLLPINQRDGTPMSCLGPVPNDTTHDQAIGQWELMVDPHSLELKPDAHGPWRILSREFLGNSWRYRIQQDDQRLVAIAALNHPGKPGDHCEVIWHNKEEAQLLPCHQPQ